MQAQDNQVPVQKKTRSHSRIAPTEKPEGLLKQPVRLTGGIAELMKLSYNHCSIPLKEAQEIHQEIAKTKNWGKLFPKVKAWLTEMPNYSVRQAIEFIKEEEKKNEGNSFPNENKRRLQRKNPKTG